MTDPAATPIDVLIARAGEVLDATIGEVTISGTVSGLRQGRYLGYAKLVTNDPATNSVTARLPLVFRPGTIKGRPLNGAHVEVVGRLTGHLLYGPIQFTVLAVEVIDPESAATRSVAALRQRLLTSGADRANKTRPLAYDAQRIAVVCPLAGGAGGTDFVNRLTAGTFDWRISRHEVSMGTPGAAREIAAAIRRAATGDIDAVVVCRGGGASSDLAPFDSPDIAAAIVEAPKPVIVAVGHAIDTHIADLVAHTSLPTPSAAADWLIRQRSTAAVQAQQIATRASQAAAAAQRSEAAAAQHHAESARARSEAAARRSYLIAVTAAVIATIIVAAVIALAVG